MRITPRDTILSDGVGHGSLREGFAHFVSDALEFITRRLRATSASANPSDASPSFSLGLSGCTSVVALVCLYVVWVMNCSFIHGYLPAQQSRAIVCPASKSVIPKRLEYWLTELGMFQEWRMFSPNPANPSVWIRIAGLQKDGVVVDLWDGGEPSLHLPPIWHGNLYTPPKVQWADQRWVKYFEFSSQPTSCNMLDFGSYVCRNWENSNNPQGLHGLAILRFYEMVHPETYTVGQPEYTVIHYQWCFDASKAVILQEGTEAKWFLRTAK